MKLRILAWTMGLCFLTNLVALAADSVWKAPDYSFSSIRSVQFRNLDVPENIKNRPLLQKTIAYALETSAAQAGIKNVTFYRFDAPTAQPDVYIDTTVESYNEVKSFVEASASTTLRSSTKTVQLYDPPTRSYYNETRYSYWTDITDQPGYYIYQANVGVRMKWIDAKTGAVIYTYYKKPSNDTRTDAVQDIGKSVAKELKKLWSN